MINYQPLNLSNEWKLFLYNSKVLHIICTKSILEQRINSDTYSFCIFFAWFLLPSSLLFILPFIRIGLFTRAECLYFAFIIQAVACIFCFWVLGRRLQDWSIPQYISFLLLGGCIWGSYIMGYSMTFDVHDPFSWGRGRGGYSLILKLPQYLEWMMIFVLLGFLIPDNKKKNRFGEASPCGIILFGRRFSNSRTGDIYSYKKFEDFDELKSAFLGMAFGTIRGGRIFLKEAFNFRGRSSDTALGVFGWIIVFIQFITSTCWYTGCFEFSNLFVTLCIAFHILLFIPSISFFTRRLHDCYCSALWIPFMYIPMINLFVYAILLFGKSWEIEDFHLAQGERV